MSAGLRASVCDYLSERRARGYRLADHERLLGAFLDGLDARGATRITVTEALAFATARPQTQRSWQAKRLAAVREFAWYVHGIDPAAAEPIPAGLIDARVTRPVPYLCSDRQTAQLMSAAALLPATTLAASMQTLIGLLASTGLRSGEASVLDAGDLDAAAGLLTVTGKYGRIRLVALQSTTVQALTGYLRVRASRAAPADPLLIGETGHRLNLNMARHIFRSLTRQCRLAPQPGCGEPRLHDFRITATLSPCACKLQVSGDQPSRCYSVTSPLPRRAPTFRPTSSSSSGHSTALPRPAPARAGTQPKTNCSRSSRPCDYAELRGQVTAPASGNAPGQPRLRHNGDISTIVQRHHRVVPVRGQAVPFAGQGGERFLRGLLQARGGHLLLPRLVDYRDCVIPGGVCLLQPAPRRPLSPVALARRYRPRRP